MSDLLIGFIELVGAFIFWAFKGFKAPFHKELKYAKRNMLVGAIIWILAIALIVLIAGRLSNK